jgi:tryptophan-rich sensory protein
MRKIESFNVIRLIIAILICQMIGLIGAVFTSSSVSTWYVTLTKPSFNPPNWVFAPVWTTLYIMMGISVFLVWEQGLEDQKVKMSLSIFGIQLILNLSWTIIFFGLKSTMGGLVVIIILWFLILLTILHFYKLSKVAGIILLPYIMWVSFATVLNTAIVILNH